MPTAGSVAGISDLPVESIDNAESGARQTKEAINEGIVKTNGGPMANEIDAANDGRTANSPTDTDAATDDVGSLRWSSLFSVGHGPIVDRPGRGLRSRAQLTRFTQ
jgi:hypothetical protein